jgi:hypothetical protein
LNETEVYIHIPKIAQGVDETMPVKKPKMNGSCFAICKKRKRPLSEVLQWMTEIHITRRDREIFDERNYSCGN